MGNKKFKRVAGAVIPGMVLSLMAFAPTNVEASSAAKVAPWQHGSQVPSGSPTEDPMLLYGAGGLDGKVSVIGLPSMRTFRHIDVGVDLHEPVFSGTNQGNKNGTPDGNTSMLTTRAPTPLVLSTCSPAFWSG